MKFQQVRERSAGAFGAGQSGIYDGEDAMAAICVSFNHGGNENEQTRANKLFIRFPI